MDLRRPFLIVASVLLASVMALPAPAAPRQVSHSGRVDADVDVEVYNISGSVRVLGWERNEVDLKGTVGEGVERVEFENDEDDVEIRVVAARRYRRDPELNVGESHLEIRVPRGATVSVETLVSSITVTDVDGEVDLQASAGAVIYSGAATDIEVGTAAGNIEVTSTARGASIDIEGVAGNVVVQFAEASIDASTLTGELRAIGGLLTDADFESVSGTVYFEGEIGRGARLDVENFNGDVELLIPGDSAVSCELVSYSGSIETEFGYEGRREDTYSPEQTAEFVLGDGGGGAEVSVETFSGTIRVRRR